METLREERIRDVLRSPAASAVLFEIIAGKRSPIEISRVIGDTPPAIIKQLWRLRDARIVMLAEKDGKFQNYDVNWERLVEEFVGRMVNLATAMVLASLSHNVERYNSLERLKFRLSENKHFRSLFKAFMEEEAKRRETRDVYLITTETFQDAVDKFEKFLPRLFQFLKKEMTDPEMVELLSLFQILCEAVEEANDFEAHPLKNALIKTGLL